jgi:phosphohistidine phosphatase SixA
MHSLILKIFKLKKKKFLIYLISYLFFSAFITITISSISVLYEKRFKIETNIKQIFILKKSGKNEVSNENDILWAKKILQGGYILHFRHAERDKWLDVQMYDALESDVHAGGKDGSRYAENDYFAKAVCLNEKGKVQAKAMGEHIKRIGLPASYIVSSVSCRARQTADLVFGGYNDMNRLLVHDGPYNEKIENRIKNLTSFYISLPYYSNGNVIILSHNGVIKEQLFDINSLSGDLSLEEGGFYVISNKNKKLTLEYKFTNFNSFSKVFYNR